MLKVKYSYISSQVLRSQNPVRFAKEQQHAYIWGMQHMNQAVMNLNHGHKHNILSPVMIGELNRFLESYDLDDAIKLIWMGSTSKEVFSKGTDLKYLKYLSHEDACLYLREVQRLAIKLGTFNKPLLAMLQGEVSGSMAAMMANLPFPLNNRFSGMRFNDIDSKFTPHGGATYTLSRLPLELGTYYALTGRYISSTEQQYLKLSFATLVEQDDAMEHIQRMILDVAHPVTDYQYGNQYKQLIEKMEIGEMAFYESLVDEFYHRQKDEDARLVFAELMYKLKSVEQANLVNKFKQDISNPFLTWKERIDGAIMAGSLREQNTVFKLDTALISRCFSSNSLKDIKQRLAAEDQNQFAQTILEELDCKDEHVLELTLLMLREAENLTWRDCLNMEYNVACNLSKQRSDLYTYFEEPKIKLESLPNALQPIKEFYQQYPDNIRYFLNEQSLRGDMNRRSEQEIDLMCYLQNNGYSGDQDVSVQEMRALESKTHELQRLVNLKINKLKCIIQHRENIEHYIQKRVNLIKSTPMTQMIQQSINKLFDDSFQERLSVYKHVAQTASMKTRIQVFSKVRNILLNTKLTKGKIEDVNWTKAMAKLLVFPENDRDSFLSSQLGPFEDPIRLQRFDIKDLKQKAQYETKYGTILQEFQPEINSYYNKLIEKTKFHKSINEFIISKEHKDIVSILKDNQEQLKIVLDQNFKDDSQDLINALDKELDTLRYKLSEKEQQYDLASMIHNSIGDSLDLVLKSHKFSTIQEQLKHLLIQTYESRVKNVPQLSGLGIVDEELNRFLKNDAFTLIEGSLFFSYSHVMILYLERNYFFLKNIQDLKIELQLKRIKDEINVNLKSKEQLTEFTEYLNDLLRVALGLYDKYRGKLVATSDRMLLKLVDLTKGDDSNIFRYQALLNGEVWAKALQSKEQDILDFQGQYDVSVSQESVIEALEAPIEDEEQGEEELSEEEEDDEDTFDLAWAGEYEQKVFYQLNRILKQKYKDQRELILGIDHYLSQMDLIALKQKVSTPKEFADKITELEKILDQKWIQDSEPKEWLSQYIDQVVKQLFSMRKGCSSFDFHLQELLEEKQFKKAMLMSLKQDQLLLQQLHEQMNQTEEEPKKSKEIIFEDQALYLALTEVDTLTGKATASNPAALYLATKDSHPLQKEAKNVVEMSSEYDYRISKRVIQEKLEQVIKSWSQSTKVPVEIEQLYERVKQRQQQQ